LVSWPASPTDSHEKASPAMRWRGSTTTTSSCRSPAPRKRFRSCAVSLQRLGLI